MAQADAGGPPFWSQVLRALREARGVTREGWAARLGYGRTTVQRWETGEAVPDAEAEEALLRACAELGLFRSFDRGVLQGHTVTPEWLRHLLAEARLGSASAPAPPVPTPPPRDHIPPPPPPRPRTNLPTPLTSFIGREPELEAGRRLLATARLLTLTGPGGSGKTRLALELAARALPEFADGAWFVDLSGVTDPALVPATIAHTLGVQESGTPVMEALKAFLRDRTLLLLLDNFEQVSAAALTVVELLQAAPRVKALVTSRAALQVRGEHELPVPPLPVPDPRRLPPTHTLMDYAGTALFLERARAVRPDFTLTPEHARAVAEICARLDGLPLAIELAAVHVRVLPPRLLADRLEQRLPALAGGMRDLPARHRTLADTIAWSYDLLSAAEQRLFRRLGVFAGGWTLEAAEAVCADDALEGAHLVEALNALAASSLIVVEADDPPRYRMLQTIREYAQERLAESGEAPLIFRRHREWFLRLAEQPLPQPALAGRGWLQKLAQEHDNFRTALTWCLAEGDTVTGLRLAAALGRFWYEHGHVAEGLEWLERLLAFDGSVPPSVRARALAQAGWLAWEQGAFERAGTYLAESLELHRHLHDLHGTADTLVLLGRYSQVRGDWDMALARFQEALDLYQELSEPLGVAEAVGRMGFTLYAKGEWERAAALCEESVALRRRHGDQFGTFDALCVLARIASRRQEMARATELYEQALALARAADNERWLADVLVEAGIHLSRTGAHQRALTYQQEALTLYHRRGTRVGVVYALDAIAGTLVVMGDAERAVRLFGAADALREAIGLLRPPAFRGIYQRVTELARRTLGEAAYAAAWTAGRALPLEEAVAEALHAP
jgi:predicted ATPase/transcriptional regulator with XRE-family HTH domain